jgi:hypothetical protein
VEQLVNKDEPKRRRIGKQAVFKDDPALADERGGVHRSAAIRSRQKLPAVRSQLGQKRNLDRTPHFEGQSGPGGEQQVARTSANRAVNSQEASR